jgi:Leucine-rich repeat (LRR) protein
VALVEALKYHPQLGKLVLGYNKVKDRGAAAIASLFTPSPPEETRPKAKLKAILLARNHIKGEGIVAISRALARPADCKVEDIPSLTHLDISENEARDEGIIAMVLHHPSIHPSIYPPPRQLMIDPYGWII